MSEKYDCLALFSGGLDSILACKVIQKQGLKVLGLHFVSPFFGKPDKCKEWEHSYKIDILPLDVSQAYLDMILSGPSRGFGKALNPCIDCKIFMLRQAKQMLDRFQAKFIISGEVLGQRPMSQRRDTLNAICNEAQVEDLLLRPLSAKNLAPTPVETNGLVNREGLLSLSGRGRKEQLQLAQEYNIEDIPTPAGGCLLTEPETVKRYWPLIKYITKPQVTDFHLANIGRQYWSDSHWLIIGRDQEDNLKLNQLVQESDLVFKVTDHPGPLAIGRQINNTNWDAQTIRSAASFMASFSPKAVKTKEKVKVSIRKKEETSEVEVLPDRETSPAWKEPTWESFKKEKLHWSAEKSRKT